MALPGFAHFFKENSEEEREHADKLLSFQNKRGGRIFLQDIKVSPVLVCNTCCVCNVQCVIISFCVVETWAWWVVQWAGSHAVCTAAGEEGEPSSAGSSQACLWPRRSPCKLKKASRYCTMWKYYVLYGNTYFVLLSAAVWLSGEPLPERAGGGHQETGRLHHQPVTHGCSDQQDGRVPVWQAHPW